MNGGLLSMQKAALKVVDAENKRVAAEKAAAMLKAQQEASK
jgi:hypothetical protein